MAIYRKELEFTGVDDWNRPVFKHANGFYYCSVDQLLNASEANPETIEAVLKNINDGQDELYFKGRSPDGEHDYPVAYLTL